MSTPISSTVSYATSADLQARKDLRQIEDFILDNGTRATAAQAANSPNVTAALMDASGMIEMSCIRGEKYTVSDLQSLNGAGKNILVKLCVELAWWCLTSRRLSKQQLPPEALWAFSVLDDLSSGAKIFPLAAQAEAGIPNEGIMQNSDWNYLNLASQQARRFLGVRANRREPNQSGGPPPADDCGSCG